MAIKELQTRIALKYDSYSAWTSAPGKDLVLLKGELGICEIPSANTDSHVAPTVLFKVGDGSKTFEKLTWASAKAADVYSWAKASEVKRDGKKLVFVGGAADGSNLEVAFDYVTLAEVQNITNGLASRISALETSVGANGDLGKAVADHETRLDKLEGADTVEGSVANALKVAKAYTDTREVEIKKYADQAETDAVTTAKGYTDAEVKKVADALDLDEAALAAHLADKENPHEVTAEQIGLGNVENKSVATIKSELGANGTIEANKTGFATGGAVYTAVEAAKDAAIDHADELNTAMDTRVDALESFKSAQDTKNGELAQDITAEATARENADNAINDKIGTVATGKTVVGMISDAQAAAEANAATTAQNKVDALANGQVETNRANIAAMDTAYKAADTALGNRITTIEGKLADVTNVMDFRGAVEALPAVTGYQNGDVIVVTAGDNKGKEYVLSDGAWVEFGNTDANAAAISNLQGRMTTAEGDIEKLEKAAEDLDAADTALGARIDKVITDYAAADTTALNTAKSYAEEKASAAETAAKSHAEAKASAAQTAAEATAKTYTDGKVTALNAADEAMAADIAALEKVTAGYTEEGSIKNAVDAKLATATFDTWTSEHEKGHAKSASEITTEITTAVNAEKSAREKAVSAVDAKVDALDTRVTTAEGNITTIQGIVSTGANANATLRSDITELQGIVKTGADANATLRTDLTTLQGVVNHGTTGLAATKAIADTAKTKAEDAQARVEAIEADYLTSKDELIFNCGTSTTVVHNA
jgi:hypothetical protein